MFIRQGPDHLKIQELKALDPSRIALSCLCVLYLLNGDAKVASLISSTALTGMLLSKALYLHVHCILSVCNMARMLVADLRRCTHCVRASQPNDRGNDISVKCLKT